MWLVGDVGGTKTDLALCEKKDKTILILRESRFQNAQFSSLTAVISSFISAEKKSIEGAVFGVAGPVIQEEATLANCPWIIRLAELRHTLGFERVKLVNDLEAYAFGIPFLAPNDFLVLHSGDSEIARGKPQALVALGTGLGHATIFPSESGTSILASEGGHISFPPRNAEEVTLLQFLWNKWERVSVERILSGPGLYEIFQFYTQQTLLPEWLKDSLKKEDPSAIIAQLALEKKSKFCEKSLQLLVSLYGAHCGDFALSVLARGGIYLAGGIPPKILPALQTKIFLKAFQEKGRMTSLMQQIPISVILNPKTPFFGATAIASTMPESIQ